MEELHRISLLQYPYVNELGTGCNGVMKRNELYVKCGNECVGTYCKICKLNLNLIDINERIVSGFKGNKPTNFKRMLCFKKIMKKSGYNIMDLKKHAKTHNLTLNMDYINEMCKPKTKKKIKEDITCVSDSDEEEDPRIIRGRGRPKNLNTKDANDLFDELIHGASDSSDDDAEEEPPEVHVEPFNYNGSQTHFNEMSLWIDDNDIVYTSMGEILGNYYRDINEIIDRFG